MAFMERWTQTSYRFRDDDGTESGATWRQNADVDDTLLTTTTYRIRFLISASHAGSGSADFTGGFQYNHLGTDWNPITTTSSVVKAMPDDLDIIADDANTTEQMAGAATFVAGRFDETGSCSAVSMSETQESEFELCFQIVTAHVSNSDTIQIKMVDDGSDLFSYSATPTITVSIPAAAGSPNLMTLLGVG